MWVISFGKGDLGSPYYKAARACRFSHRRRGNGGGVKVALAMR